MITSYFSIVRQTVQDMVPKAIMHYLVNETCETVQNRLVKALYKDSLFADLLQEDETTLADRNRVKATLDAYKEAFRVCPLLRLAFVAHEWHRNCRITLRPASAHLYTTTVQCSSRTHVIHLTFTSCAPAPPDPQSAASEAGRRT
jgi:hypothetical protein